MNWSKKFLIFVFSFFIILLFVFVILLMVHVKKTDAIVFSDDLTCNYRDVVHVEHFIKSINGNLLDNYLVDTSALGKKQLDVRYKNQYGFVEKSKVSIEVIDTVSPIIFVDDPYVISKGDVSKLEDTIFCADDYDDHIQCTISGEYDLNQVGNYPLSIIASDKTGNESKKNFVLKVVDKKEIDQSNGTPVKFNDIYQKYSSEYDIGLDVSKWQENVDFEKVAQQGVSFVMIKLGGQSEINGEITLDPNFYTNIDKAIQNDLKVGVYFYSYAKSVNEAKKQAKWVAQILKDYHLDLPVAFDWENWEKYSTFGIGFRMLNRIASSFITEINRYQYQGMLYSSKYYLENIWYSEDYSNIWLAYYHQSLDYDGKFSIWQVCNTGIIDGINGFVDIDLLKK